LESDFLLLAAVTDLDRLIFDRRLKLFYFLKLYFKFELFDLYLTVEIQNQVKLRSTTGNPDQKTHTHI
jgi:hypothetical protein